MTGMMSSLAQLTPVLLLLFRLYYKHNHVKINKNSEILKDARNDSVRKSSVYYLNTNSVLLVLHSTDIEQHEHTSTILFLPSCWDRLTFHLIMCRLHILAAATHCCELDVIKLK